MKKLICAKDIEKLVEKGQSTLHVDSQTIITPSALDLAKEKGVSIEESPAVCQAPSQTCGQALDPQFIYSALLQMQEAGLLTDDFLNLLKKNNKYEAIKTPKGLKLIKGRTVTMDPFEDFPGTTYQELVSKKDSALQAGLLNIGSHLFVKSFAEDVVYYVIQGPLEVAFSGQTHDVQSGDVLFVPGGQEMKAKAKYGQGHLFYAETMA